MVNYNQKYKNEVIVVLTQSDTNSYDSNVSDNKFFASVGQKTSGSFNNIARVYSIYLWCVKPDAIINTSDNASVRIYDDDGTLTNINLSGSNNQFTGYEIRLSSPLRFGSRDTNITFDNFNSLDGMTQDIEDLMDSENVNYLT